MDRDTSRSKKSIIRKQRSPERSTRERDLSPERLESSSKRKVRQKVNKHQPTESNEVAVIQTSPPSSPHPTDENFAFPRQEHNGTENSDFSEIPDGPKRTTRINLSEIDASLYPGQASFQSLKSDGPHFQDEESLSTEIDPEFGEIPKKRKINLTDLDSFRNHDSYQFSAPKMDSKINLNKLISKPLGKFF